MEEEDEILQRLIVDSPNIISYETTKTWIEQMEQNTCKINIGNLQGTGFFCEIPFPDENNTLPVFITNNHIINEKLLYQENLKIEIEIMEDGIKKFNLKDRMKYTNKDYDITIIEIKDSDDLSNYLELDDKLVDDIINNDNRNEIYINNTLYIMQYPEGKLSVSYGKLENISNDKKYNFFHKCSTKHGSSGSPISNLNNKIIGIHKQGLSNKENRGTFLNYPIKEFIKLNYPNYNIKQFSKKYNYSSINDTSIEKVKLGDWPHIGDKGFGHLSTLEFTNLKELIISEMDITNLKPLERMKLDKLEVLEITHKRYYEINYYISILSKIDLRNLKTLDLTGGGITDISALENVNFEKLERLIFFYNKISDISILGRVNLKN